MPIDYSKLRSITARDIVRALLADGFVLTAGATSHRRYKHADGRRVTVAYHRGGGTFVPKTLRSMIEEQARWTEVDLRRLKLIK